MKLKQPGIPIELVALEIFCAVSLFAADGICHDRNYCVPMGISLGKLTAVEEISEIDSAVLYNSELLAQAIFGELGYSTDSSILEIRCSYLLPQLDSLLLIVYSFGPLYMHSLTIIYDPVTKEYCEKFKMGLGGLNYLVLRHPQNSNFQDKLLMTRLYFTLTYDLMSTKYYPLEIDKFIDDVFSPPTFYTLDDAKLFKKVISNCKSGVYKEGEKEFYDIYDCIYTRSVLPFYKISARVCGSTFIKFDFETVNYWE